MDTCDSRLARFETERTRLRMLVRAMLNSSADADDVLQEAWLRFARVEPDTIANVPAWLTTVVTRLAIDMLRARDPWPDQGGASSDDLTQQSDTVDADPMHAMILAESLGLALVVVQRLRPPERVAFVLHDAFGVPFASIAELLGCTDAAARQHATRARRAIRATPPSDVCAAEGRNRLKLVTAFFTASRDGDISSLLQILHPDVALTITLPSPASPAARHIAGARQVAPQALAGAAAAGEAGVVMINGKAGIVAAANGSLSRALCFEISDATIIAIRVILDADELRALDLQLI